MAPSLIGTPGPTFRYRPDSILINTPAAYRALFGPKGNVKKGLFYEAWPRNVNALTTWNSTDLEVHGRKRRVLNYAFSDKALRSAEPFVISNADRWCEVIADEISETGWSTPLNMADWVNYLVFDILGDLCFGKSFDMKERDSGMKYVPSLMVDFLTLMHPVGPLSLFLYLHFSLTTTKTYRLHSRPSRRSGCG